MPKSWQQKFAGAKPLHIEVIGKSMFGLPVGTKLAILDPPTVDDYVRRIPSGSARTIQQLRADLAAQVGAEASCQISTSIFLRIAAECALEQLAAGCSDGEVTPFWRVVEPSSPLAKKLSCGPEFIANKRRQEGIL